MINIGVLSVQGDVFENVQMVRGILDEGDVVSAVKTPQSISDVDGLIIPGGESTTIGQLSLVNGAIKKIKEKIESGMPVFGICAGLVMLSKSCKDKVVGDTKQPLLDSLNVTVERNSFGRQRDSFEGVISLDSIGIDRFPGVFIRAPIISSAESSVEVLSKIDGGIVAVKEGNILGVSFHPELTSDASLHKYFINLVRDAKG